jgi:hypothetical protein
LSSYEEVHVDVLQWFNKKRAEGTPVSGPMCTQKAKFFHKALGLEGEFNAFVGWLTRFKKYGIREIPVQGARLSANDAAVNKFHVKFQKFVQEENLKPDQIYNTDESGLYWKAYQQKPLCLKERTVLLGINRLKNALRSCVVEVRLEITN